MKKLSRAFPVILALALVSGAWPQGASAQVVRIAAGEGMSMPVAPGAASRTNTGTDFTPSLTPVGLTGTFAAPSVAPKPVINTAVAPALTPVAGVIPALAASPIAAASKDNPETPDVPKAATPAPAQSKAADLLTRLGMPTVASWISRKPSVKAAAAPETPNEDAAADANKMFDGSEAKAPAEGDAVKASGESRFSKTRLGQRLAVSAAKRRAHVDEFGGPLSEPMTFKQRVGFGLKSGLNLVGIGALMKVTVAPLLAIFPWPQYMSDAALRGVGRVALLTKMGPEAIAQGLADNPIAFMGLHLPLAVAMEELTYRLLGFGAIFLVLAALKPFSRWVASMIGSLPDAAGVVGASKKVLKIGDWLSHLAFPIAAAISSFNFAVAHFGAWGVSPFIFLLNAMAGVFLAHTAYKSRSLTSPIVAHLIFNLVPIATMFVALVVSPMAGSAMAIIAGLLGVASLFHSWLNARKERAWRMSGGGRTLLIALLALGGAMGVMNDPSGHKASQQTVSATIRQIQDQKTETAPIPAAAADSTATPADTTAAVAPVESREAMVARVKGSVVNVIVRMPQGMATGSGFILTPSGVFVTNGHVVGSRQPGQFVEARIPGVPGVMKAKVLAVNHDKDLAIVQLQRRPDGKPWPTVKLADKAPLEGEDVTATGYPRGLPFTVTAGVISGMDGRGNMYVKHLQTDASINPGNSGGPLFNARGEVVGVNTQIYTESGGSEGLGFSIMAPEVARVMAQYQKTGNIATASLGIISNLSDPMKPEAGLEVEYARHGSAAEKAGILRGDLIISVGGESIEESGGEAAGHIAAVLSRHIPGQQVPVVVLRGDAPVELSLTADAKVTTAPSH